MSILMLHVLKRFKKTCYEQSANENGIKEGEDI